MPAQEKIIEIRSYNDSDLDCIIEIFLDAVRNIASKDYTQEQIDAWAQVNRENWIKRRLNRQTWIAEVDGLAAGWTDLEPNGHLDMLFVHSAFRGIGVATALLNTVETAARKFELKRIFVEASLTARPVFERHGYKVILEQSVFVRGAYLTNFQMEKSLN